MTSLEQATQYLNSFDKPIDDGSLSKLLHAMVIDKKDLEPWHIFGEQTYRRNSVSSTAWYELLVLCWRPGHCSTIHDHAGSTCAFRVMNGTVTEELFDVIAGDLVTPRMVRHFATGSVCVASHADIHQLRNDANSTTDLVTLHIYSPPLKMNTYRLDPAKECAAIS